MAQVFPVDPFWKIIISARHPSLILVPGDVNRSNRGEQSATAPEFIFKSACSPPVWSGVIVISAKSTGGRNDAVTDSDWGCASLQYRYCLPRAPATRPRGPP